MNEQISEAPRHGRWHSAFLALGALGVVYGDIGTSPLYALRVCLGQDYNVETTRANVLGILSLILWALVFVISIKYIVFIMRADNRGEGGILSLMALVRRSPSGGHADRAGLVALGLFGAALLYGDGMITPAISVLSAVEGLEVAAPALTHFVVPVTVALLVALFLFQRKGTAGIGSVFGPIMLIWFIVMAVLGAAGIARQTEVLEAVNPWYGVRFFMDNGLEGFLVLGAVFLVETGGEALYADMGHFGKGPIRLAWYLVVLPSLLLNYFGQGALLWADPGAERNPFFLLAPDWARSPLVFLAAVATIIASQAVISGSFSLTRQAVQLGYCPRLEIRHTSSEEIGQIYAPVVNWTLMVATIALVLAFETSDNLAAAYGIAVTTTMLITTILFFFVGRERWRWPMWAILPLTGAFLIVDSAFFGANIFKVAHGGWVPLVIAGGAFICMSTWKTGRAKLAGRLAADSLPTELFLKDVESHPPVRVRGTAVYMTGSGKGVPPALLHNLKHNKVLHERVVFLTIETEEVPHVKEEQRLEVTELGAGLFRIVARYGFMQTPNVPAALKRAARFGLQFDMMQTTFFLGRESLVPASRSGFARWRERLFVLMSRNAQTATAFFGLPANRVVELGAQIEI